MLYPQDPHHCHPYEDVLLTLNGEPSHRSFLCCLQSIIKHRRVMYSKPSNDKKSLWFHFSQQLNMITLRMKVKAGAHKIKEGFRRTASQVTSPHDLSSDRNSSSLKDLAASTASKLIASGSLRGQVKLKRRLFNLKSPDLGLFQSAR